MEIVQERLEREFDLDLVTTVPTVEYHVYRTDGEMVLMENPSKLPRPGQIDRDRGAVRQGPHHGAGRVHRPDHEAGQERRGVYNSMHYLDTTRVEFDFEFPLGEIVLDFYDKLKSLSRGYASLDYEMVGLSRVRSGEARHADQRRPGRRVQRDHPPGQGPGVGPQGGGEAEGADPAAAVQVAIQAAIGNKVIARETISAFRKDVLAKCYGGDITRKRKLLEKQKEGKKRMKQIGAVEIPQEAFLAVLQVD